MDGACKTGKIVGPPQAARVQRGAPLLYCAPACGGKVVAQPPKGGGPIGPAGCVEGLWYRPGAAKRPGFRRFKGFRGFRGEGIAFGDEYIVSVTGLAFVSPLLHDEEQKPPSLGRGWHRRRRRIGASILWKKFGPILSPIGQLLPGEGACVTGLPFCVSSAARRRAIAPFHRKGVAP